MRVLPSCLLLLTLTGLTVADDVALKEARRLWLRGNHGQAQSRFEDLLKKPNPAPAVAIGLSRCQESQGDLDAALSVIDAALKDRPKDARLKARQAELFHQRGRWDDAFKAASAALDDDKDNILAHWVLGQIHRERGDTRKADAEFRWLVRTFTQRSNDDKDVTDPDELLVIGLGGAENARWNRLADQFEVIVSDVWEDAVKNDKGYWPAEYQIGVLMLEKYNRRDALAAFDKALTINPYAAEAYAGKGVAALQRLEIQDAERFAERALNLNRKLPAALHLRADIHLVVGQVDEALKTLAVARAVNPRDEHTLGRIGACLLMQKKQDELNALIEEVKKHNPKPGVFHLVLAHSLAERRRYHEAETHYKEARKQRPMLHQATGELALLLMRLGREQEAAPLLEDAFDADPFNVRISNTRKVLTHLEKYKTLKTEHFHLKYDPTSDSVLAGLMGDFLEKTYAELADKFNHKPKGPILIEVFNNHQMFSGRTVALPDLHTIGACTGRMVALVSPKGRGVAHAFNWARVLRHELVHVFNLDQSNFLCPHWFTEGLAVVSEELERSQEWNDMLRTRVPAGDVFNLDTIDLGFIRPRSGDDWQFAYCQARLYVEYLEKTHGKAAIGGMLDAYRDGLDTVAALRKVCKVDKETFERGYRKHVDEEVKKLGGKPVEKPMKLSELRDALKDKPEDLDLLARLAEKLLDSDKDEARKKAEEVLKRKLGHPRATVVLARLEKQAGDSEKARELLEKALDRNAPDTAVLRALGRLHLDANEPRKALTLLEQGHQLEPQERSWVTDLVRVHGTLNNNEEQVKYLTKLVRRDGDDLDNRKRLARLTSTLKQFAESEKWAREALEIDVADAEARTLLFAALEEQKKKDELARLRKLLGEK